MIELRVNGTVCRTEAPPTTPLLYVLRNYFGLRATKFGCGLNGCGACTVLIDGQATHSCDIAIELVANKSITTVEGLSCNGKLHPLQQAFLGEQAAQCGYCIPGILMSAAALLDVNRNPTRADINQALSENLCRCGSHIRIIRAIERAAESIRESTAS